MTRKWLRWLPAAAVPAAIAAGVLSGSVPANAGDPLPEKNPQQVLLMLAQHGEQSLSGTLEQTSAIGLPAMPKPGTGAGSPETAWLELLAGPHTARVFFDGSNSRVQVMDPMAERDAIRNGKDLWLYNSKDDTAAHAQLPADAATRHGGQSDAYGPDAAATPEILADKLLAAMDGTTDVTVGPDVQVAGRAAYNLVLTPKSQVTLVESIAIAVDGASGLPLGVELTARGQSEPAFSVAFTSLTLEAPDPSIFNFTPPAGATVKEIPLPAHASGVPAPAEAAKAGTAQRPIVTGSGWESVLEFPAGSVKLPVGKQDQNGAAGPGTANPLKDGTSSTGGSGTGAALFDQVAVAVPGGRLVSTSLVNMLILDDGRILAGSVPLERLQAAAAAGK